MIAVRLRSLVDGRQWLAIPDYLDGLSHAQFRTAGYMLGEKYMPSLDAEDFWTLAKVLVDYNAKAFLVTVLKSWTASALSRKSDPSSTLSPKSQTPETISLKCETSAAFFASLRGREEDQRKTMQTLLPVLKDVTTVEWLEQTMGIVEARKRVAFYLNSTTVVTGFLLLQALHQLEEDRSLLIRTTHYLIKRGDGFSFNLASLFCVFFGLEEVKGTFSLRIQPYELARLSTDFEAFRKTLKV